MEQSEQIERSNLSSREVSNYCQTLVTMKGKWKGSGKGEPSSELQIQKRRNQPSLLEGERSFTERDNTRERMTMSEESEKEGRQKMTKFEVEQ